MLAARAPPGSQFWKRINKLTDKFQWGASFVVSNGEKTMFWENMWIKDSKLKDLYPRLYNCCRDRDVLVVIAGTVINGTWNFRRSSGGGRVERMGGPLA